MSQRWPQYNNLRFTIHGRFPPVYALDALVTCCNQISTNRETEFTWETKKNVDLQYRIRYTTGLSPKMIEEVTAATMLANIFQPINEKQSEWDKNACKTEIGQGKKTSRKWLPRRSGLKVTSLVQLRKTFETAKKEAKRTASEDLWTMMGSGTLKPTRVDFLLSTVVRLSRKRGWASRCRLIADEPQNRSFAFQHWTSYEWKPTSYARRAEVWCRSDWT